MSNRLFAGARMLRRAVAPAVERAYQNKTMDPDKLASRRRAEASVPTIKATLGPKWQTEVFRCQAQVGSLLPDWRVAEILLAEWAVENEEARLRWGRNAPRAYAPKVQALKASMSAEAWELERARVLRQTNFQRTHRGEPPFAQIEDWQIAEWIELDNEGNPV